jgi:hypothetical protein
MLVRYTMTSVLAFGCVCAASEPSHGPESMRGSQAVAKLSQVLPESLAEFVTCFSIDRDLSKLPAEVAERFVSGSPTIDDMIEYVAPSEVLGISGPITLEFSDDDGDRFSMRATRLIAGSEMTLDDETTLPFGGEISTDVVVLSGVVVNAGETDIVVRGLENRLTLKPGMLLVARCANSCSIDGCASGTFSCCWWPGGCARCRCVTSEPNGTCDSGGANSTGCSITDTDVSGIFVP